MAMKRLLILCLIVPGFAMGQTLYVPSGTSGIGSSSNGNVGIGTASPLSKLTIAGDLLIQSANIPMGLMTEVGGYNPLLNFSLNFREPNKDNTYRGAAFRIDSRSDAPLYQWLSRSAGSTIENLTMVLTESGNLGVGTATPDQKLTVNGTVHATRVKVETTVLGPDYVFENDYALPSLEQIKSYIAENKHLPEVPSAKEMEAKGIDVGEMNMLLLKKVEELTLYLIEQQTRIAKMEGEMEQLKETKTQK
jgi:hypothetical protein